MNRYAMPRSPRIAVSDEAKPIQAGDGLLVLFPPNGG